MINILLFISIFSKLEATEECYIRGCYFTNWSQYRTGSGKYTVEDYVPGLCTHIFYAFAGVHKDNTIKSTEWNDESSENTKGQFEKLNDLKRTDKELKKTLLSVGGWVFGTQRFKEMTGSLSNRTVFINSSILYLRQWGFDGLDIDWEFPSQPITKTNFAIFLKEAKEAMILESETSGKPELLLTTAVAAGLDKIQAGYDIPEMAKYVDYIAVMSYDFHGSWENYTGMNSPLYANGKDVYNVESASQYWYKNGMPLHKILVGLPAYGRGWTLLDNDQCTLGAQAIAPSISMQSTNEKGIAAFYEICQLLKKGGRSYWDEALKQSYVVFGDQWFSYDDAASFKSKLEWIKDSKYGGAFVWSLDLDDFGGIYSDKRYPLISLLREIFGNYC